MNEICILQIAVSHNTEICRHTLSVIDDRNLLFLVLNSIPWCTYTTVRSQKDIFWVSILSVSLAPLHKCQSHWPRRWVKHSFSECVNECVFPGQISIWAPGFRAEDLPDVSKRASVLDRRKKRNSQPPFELPAAAWVCAALELVFTPGLHESLGSGEEQAWSGSMLIYLGDCGTSRFYNSARWLFI